MLVELGYGIAYRVLDAQYFGVPQRRRRVFVVGYLGNWRAAAAVLLEQHGLSGYPPSRREAGKDIARTLSARAHGGGGPGSYFDIDGGLISMVEGISRCLNAGGTGRQDISTETMVVHALSAEGFDASEDGTGRGVPMIPIAICTAHTQSNGSGFSDGIAHSLERGTTQAVAFSAKDYGADASDVAPTLRGMGHDASHANGGGQVAIAFAQNQSGDVPSGEPISEGWPDQRG